MPLTEFSWPRAAMCTWMMAETCILADAHATDRTLSNLWRKRQAPLNGGSAALGKQSPDWRLCSSAEGPTTTPRKPALNSQEKTNSPLTLWTNKLCDKIKTLLFFDSKITSPDIFWGLLQSLVQPTEIDFYIEDFLMLFTCEFVVYKAELLIPRAAINSLSMFLNVLLAKNRNTKRINQNQGINTKGLSWDERFAPTFRIQKGGRITLRTKLGEEKP